MTIIRKLMEDLRLGLLVFFALTMAEAYVGVNYGKGVRLPERIIGVWALVWGFLILRSYYRRSIDSNKKLIVCLLGLGLFGLYIVMLIIGTLAFRKL